MKILSKILSFRNQIILAVIALSVIPLSIFGINAVYLAGESQKVVDKIKQSLVANITREAENYFDRINRDLSFTASFEKNIMIDDVRIGMILMNALQSQRELSAVGYIRKGRLISYLGEKIKSETISEKIAELTGLYEKENIVQLSKTYKFSGEYLFDILYPLDNGDFVLAIFSVRELNEKLEANAVNDTGKFAVVTENAGSFIAGEELDFRFQFLEMDEILSGSRDNGEINIEKRGYIVKAKKIEGVLWPMWMVFTQKVSEANMLTRQLKLRAIFTFLLIIMIAGFISFSLARNFSRPIANLLKAVKSNFKGELDTKAEVNENDSGELAMLLNSFNSMIDKLKETREKLIEKEQLAAVGEMANIIGHDIRNPLAAIKNGAYYIRHAMKDENKRIEMSLDIIDREIVSITNIIEDLLGFSRQRPPALSPVNVNELMDEIISIIELPENTQIKKEYKAQLPEYNLDRGEMRQVFVNLINNAVQACKDREKGLVSVITGQETGGDLKVIIRDNGVGIPKDKLDQVFKAFYSTKAGGTGLGMSSAKNIVDRHEGTINIHSAVDKGTDITVIIPQKIQK
ncbi:MAG: GHKL domain-containing protein [Elusimicrobia bacterium]|nr:GHKL domain-containing protein [Elusimicrobiota bacterium]